jgi:hypothetical protein
MPYFFKLSERREDGWFESMLTVAWYVASACEDENDSKKKKKGVRFYLVRQSIPESLTSNADAFSVRIKMNTSDIRQHKYEYEYFFPGEIIPSKLIKFGITNDEIITNVLDVYKRDKKIGIQMIKNLNPSNPIRRLYDTYFPNIDNLFLHITCEKYDYSINKKGLLSEADLTSTGHIRTLNSKVGGKIKNKTRRFFKKPCNKKKSNRRK